MCGKGPGVARHFRYRIRTTARSGFARADAVPTMRRVISRRTGGLYGAVGGTTGKFHFDTEDTGPAYTQVQIQHRSRAAPGPPSAFHTFRRKSFAFHATSLSPGSAAGEGPYRNVSERVVPACPQGTGGCCSSSVPLPCSASCDDASQKRKSKSTIAVQYNILNEHIWQRAHMARLRRPYQTPLTCLHVACAQVLGHDTGSRRSVALRCAWREGRRHRRRAAPCIPALGSVVPS